MGSTVHGIRIGTSGWVYGPWHGSFYPRDLRRGAELNYLATRLNTVEVNASFYSLQRPDAFRQWVRQTPDDFVFAVKGSRYITHMKKLRAAETALANFFASGVLALGTKLGPLLWQLPPSLGFDADRLAEFFDLLPRSTGAAAELARRHDDRVRDRALTEADVDQPIRHALEVRHPGFATPEAVELLRDKDIGLVVADTAGKWPYLEDVTSDFVYIRLHGDEELYVSGYGAEALDRWAERIRAWHSGGTPPHAHTVAPAMRSRDGRDVYVYFDNDVKAYAPSDALALKQRLS